MKPTCLCQSSLPQTRKRERGRASLAASAKACDKSTRAFALRESTDWKKKVGHTRLTSSLQSRDSRRPGAVSAFQISPSLWTVIGYSHVSRRDFRVRACENHDPISTESVAFQGFSTLLRTGKPNKSVFRRKDGISSRGFFYLGWKSAWPTAGKVQ